MATPEQPVKSVFHLGWHRSSCLLPAFPKRGETLSFHPQSLLRVSVISPSVCLTIQEMLPWVLFIIPWAASLKDVHLDSRRWWQSVLSFPPNRAELACLSREHVPQQPRMVYVFTPQSPQRSLLPFSQRFSGNQQG